MDHSTSPSPIGRLAKRQRRVSQDGEYESKVENYPQESSIGTIIEPKVGRTLFGREGTRKLML
ncbi:unnamed protein product [Penicillium nalgiovense]|nr:unnamed protein product [Penicillium nalgiovense]